MFTAAQTGIRPRLHQNALCFVRVFPIDTAHNTTLLVFELRIQGVALLQNNGNNRQVILARKLEIALIAARNSHNSACTVIGHDVVGNPHGNFIAVNRIYHVPSSKYAVLFVISLRALKRRHLFRLLNKR